MENRMEAPQKLKNTTAIDPAIPILTIYLKECKSGYNKGTCTSMFIVALLIINKLWKLSKCYTTDEWIKNVVFIYNGILFSHK
jgi:hypothetical protein